MLLTGSRSVAALAAGASSSGSAAVTVPGATAVGTYFVLACGDDTAIVAESNEGNNCRATTTTVQVQSATPDLVEAAVSNPPATVTQGGSFPVTDTAQNIATVGAGTSTTRYYLSLDTAKSGADVLLTGSRSVVALAAGASSSGTVSVTVPTATALGTYFVLACADDSTVVVESNESNNCLASSTTVQVQSALPDLVETAVSNPPVTVTQGGSFAVTDTAQNTATVGAGTSTTRYYLSLDAAKSAGDALLTGGRSVALAAGASSSGTVSVAVPAATALGTYFLLACADDTAVVAESNESNNCRASTTTVQVQSAPPDLVETAVSNPPAGVVSTSAR